MTSGNVRMPRFEALLAALLHYGTWLASAVVAVGLAVTLIAGGEGGGRATTATWTPTGIRVVTWGIGLFILLPVLRVVLMLAVFLRKRDGRFVVITTSVLVIMLLGFALGMSLSKGHGRPAQPTAASPPGPS